MDRSSEVRRDRNAMSTAAGHDVRKVAAMFTRFKPRALATILLVTAMLIGAAYFGVHRMRPHYPYGWSHCCDKMLHFALLQYAESHDGWFPRGEATPEASLSLLYQQEPELLDVLRGKTIPESAVRSRLERGELLTPETCGWHYVEGLRIDDDSRLALFWDKVGLGHNGEELPEGGHFVCFRSGIEYVPETKWPSFLAEQKALLSRINDRGPRDEP